MITNKFRRENIMAEKLCPMMSQSGTGITECKKEQCAWFDHINKCCVVFSIPEAIFNASLPK